jgi:gluconate kinase
MKPDLLDSQFEALEEPEAAMCIDVSASLHEIVESIKNHLRL